MPKQVTVLFLAVLLGLAFLATHALRPATTSHSLKNELVLSSNGCQKVIQRQQEALLAAYEVSLEGHRHVALLGYPDHENKGDAAIWVGEKILLAALGKETVYQASWQTYREEDLRDVVSLYPDIAILLHGGGNFGDLYMWELRPRFSVVEAFPDVPIRFFPQSIHFDSEKNVELVAAMLADHTNLHLFIRDRPSETFARSRFGKLGVDIRYVPDAAFMIGSRPDIYAKFQPQRDLLIFHRTDIEGERWPDFEAERTNLTSMQDDWFDSQYKILGKKAHNIDSLAYARFVKGAEYLRQGRFVILDRLHGHILSILLGIPHIIVDNRIGKLSNYYHSWTSECQLGKVATSTEEAHQLAKQYLRSASSSSE